ncbi:DUF4397 domain-containing protein [Sinanaerobacter sp. ZZT-01]|uniref:DUF4397 domain-containing protein n=1 Tax=Sinanaerobacter sp. ZZT-01 TaxID=3111540 RepID=UPI002D7978E8|nr:DUF4397 domain-containing protein [Sinanaerobacter sp. ZZT-01]WRR94310.1 DUF4397 domain-containing protein [Sinanaerobacter sp. ZZT-01]
MNIKKSKVYFKLGYFRIFHADPDIVGVDIYVDDKLVAEDLVFGEATAYLPVLKNNYKVSIYEAGTNNILLTRFVSVATDEIITLALAGSKTSNEDGANFLLIPDAHLIINPEKSMLCFINLSPNVPSVDVTLTDGTVLFSNVSYREITPYLSLDPGIYNLQIRITGTSEVLLEVPNIVLEADTYYSIYLIGLLGGEPPLQTVFLMDGFK